MQQLTMRKLKFRVEKGEGRNKIFGQEHLLAEPNYQNPNPFTPRLAGGISHRIIILLPFALSSRY
jgi:hypothetical protein